MSRMTTCDLRDKEIVNVSDGVRIGYPSDFEFNTADGRISALIVSRCGGLFGFCRGDDVIIPWSRVECSGADAILVRMECGEYFDRLGEKKKKSL